MSSSKLELRLLAKSSIRLPAIAPHTTPTPSAHAAADITVANKPARYCPPPDTNASVAGSDKDPGRQQAKIVGEIARNGIGTPPGIFKGQTGKLRVTCRQGLSVNGCDFVSFAGRNTAPIQGRI